MELDSLIQDLQALTPARSKALTTKPKFKAPARFAPLSFSPQQAVAPRNAALPAEYQSFGSDLDDLIRDIQVMTPP